MNPRISRFLAFSALVGCLFFVGGCCDCQPKAEAGPLRFAARVVSAPFRWVRNRRCGRSCLIPQSSRLKVSHLCQVSPPVPYRLQDYSTL